MKDIHEIHRKAMTLIKSAKIALEKGDNESYMIGATEAFNYEREAALELISEFDAEPTRSVLFRSAANIAYNIGLFDESCKLAHQGLAGNPYYETIEELSDILEKARNAIQSNAQTQLGIENAYIQILRENAVNIKLEPSTPRYSRAIVIDYITEFLRNIQTCFSKFSEINFRQTFSLDDFVNYDKTFSAFKKDTKALCVDLRFKSFGVSVAIDTSVQNYQSISGEKFYSFKKNLLSDFTNEILLADYNNIAYHDHVTNKYSESERALIFSPIVDMLKENSKYKISIMNNDFSKVIKSCPTINKKSAAILKPMQLELEQEEIIDPILKRTLEIYHSPKKKGEKILTENLEYAEFKVILENLTYSEGELFFIYPYELKIIFDKGQFVIDDFKFKVNVDDNNFKELQKKFAEKIVEKYYYLIEQENKSNADGTNMLSKDENDLLNTLRSAIVVTLKK